MASTGSDAPPVDLLPVDIAAYADGNTGIPFVHSFRADADGPHLLINALTHGNEVCGAHALCFLFDHTVRPTRGTLTLSFANVAAYERFDADRPSMSRYVDEDLNRVWTPAVLDGPRSSLELTRARELRPAIDQADFLLDIHSMQHDSNPLMLCGLADKGRDLARGLGFPAHVVADAGHDAGVRMRDYGVFADASSHRAALLVECGQHWAMESRIVAIQTALRFLRHFDSVDRAFLDAHLLPVDTGAQRVIEVTGPVTIASDRFYFTKDYTGLEVVAKAGTIIGYDGDAPVRTPYDDCVLIMPSRRIAKGQTAVRFGRYVA